MQTIDLGEAGLVPLEVRWLHDPDAEQGFVGATLASNILRFHRTNGAFSAEPVIDVENEELEGWPLPGGVPGLITDLVVSMDDRLALPVELAPRRPPPVRRLRPRQPQTDEPALARRAAREAERRGRDLGGGPQMIQLSLDGRRLYVTNSLYSSWDNQFYPGSAPGCSR